MLVDTDPNFKLREERGIKVINTRRQSRARVINAEKNKTKAAAGPWAVPPLHQGRAALNNNHTDGLGCSRDQRGTQAAISISCTSAALGRWAANRWSRDGGSNPHTSPLGQDTITIVHSHSSADAPPLLRAVPPSIAGALSVCLRPYEKNISHAAWGIIRIL